MNKFLAILAGLLVACAAHAEVYIRPINVATVVDFKLLDAAGLLDVNESDGGTDVSIACAEGAETTATNDFVDEGTFYSISITQAEMNCARVAVIIQGEIVNYFFIDTYGASAAIPGIPAAVPGAAGGLVIAGVNADFDVTANSAFAGGLTITQSTSNGAGLLITGNGTGNGATITSGNGATGTGLALVAASTNGTALTAAGVGTGNGVTFTGGATGVGASYVGGATSGNAVGMTITAPIGPVPELGIDESGTLQSASATTAVLRSATSFADDFLIGKTLVIIQGTGVGQSAIITDWVSSTDTATVSTWLTTPDNTSDYVVFATAPGTTPPTAAAIRAEIDSNSTQLAAIVADTNEVQISLAAGGLIESLVDDIGAAGAGLTAIDLPNQTMDITGTLTTVTTATNVTTVNGLAANVVTAASIANDAIGATEIANGAIDAAATAADFSTEVQDADVESINGVTVTGDGSATPFGVSYRQWRKQQREEDRVERKAMKREYALIEASLR